MRPAAWGGRAVFERRWDRTRKKLLILSAETRLLQYDSALQTVSVDDPGIMTQIPIGALDRDLPVCYSLSG
jgi:hypothetical protein